MALFTDGPLSGMEDLTAQDTQLSTVTAVEGIDVTQKMTLAQDELAIEIQAMLDGSGGVAQLLWMKPKWATRNVAVTPALKLWHTFRTLEMVYRDAYSNQLNDRYAAKRDQFAERAAWAHGKVCQLGLGIVAAPIPQAAEPQVLLAQGSLTDGTYYVAVSWTGAGGEEGALSIAGAIATSASTFVVQTGSWPVGVTGWNAYVGSDPGGVRLQNELPIPVGRAWLQPNTVTPGRTAGSGQSPNHVQQLPRMILRG